MANRPGENYSYTNNFPYDPDVGNIAVPGTLLWSALSLIVLLAGIAVVLLMFGKFDYLGWISRGQHIHPHLLPGVASPGQRALVKFFVVVALLFLCRPWSAAQWRITAPIRAASMASSWKRSSPAT